MPPRRFTDAEEQNIVDMYLSGATCGKIGKTLTTPEPTIMGILKRHYIPRRTNSESHRKYSFREDAFDSFQSEQACYWLGFIFADGTITKGRNSLSVVLSRRDIDHLHKLCSFFETNRPISEYETQCLGKTFAVASIQIRSWPLATRLRQLGIEPYRPNPTIALDTIPDNLKHHWVRGWFDGDGSVVICNNGRHIRAVFCGPKETVIAVYNLLTNKGIFMNMPQERSKSLWYLTCDRRQDCKAVFDYMYQDATVILDRKYNKMTDYFKGCMDEENNIIFGRRKSTKRT